MPREVTFQTGGGLVNDPRLLSSMDNPFSQTWQQPAFMFFYLREFICLLCRNISVIRKRLVRTVLIFTESSDQLSRATDRVPGLPASPGYVQ